MKKSTFPRNLLSLPVAASLLVAATPAFAANDLWIGNTDANFGTLGNWTGSVTPDGNTPEFGVAGTSGTTLTNDIASASYAGLLFDSGASAYTIGGNSFTLTANITNNSASTQTINNDITLSSTSHTFSGASGQLVLGGNIGGTINGSVTVAPTNKVTLGGTNNFVFTTGTFLAVLFNAGSTDITGSTTSDGGSVSNDGGFVVDANAGAATTSTLTIASGGSFHVKGSTAGAANTTPNSIIGQQSGTGVVNVGATDKSTSGTFTVDAGTGLLIGNAGGNGTLNVNSGTATINRGTIATTTTFTDTRLIMMGKDNVNSTGTINLNGGTLATGRQFVRDGSTAANAGIANFVFNGGTLQALGTQTDWLQSTTASSAGQNQGATGGTVNNAALALSSVTTTAVSTIDANGFSVAINNNISGAGGFNIASSTPGGTVIFGGTNTFTGPVNVNSGTLSLASNVSLDSAIVLSLASNTSLNLGFSTGSQTVQELDLGGNFVAPGTYTAGDLNALGSSSSITFTSSGGTLTVTAVPEPSTVVMLSLGLLFGMFAFRRSKARTIA